MRKPGYFILILIALVSGTVRGDESLLKSVELVRQTGPEGAGSVAAAEGWRELTRRDATAIVPLLRSMKDSGPLAQNWLRSAVEVIFSRSFEESPDQVPFDELRAFLLDTSQLVRARELAFSLIESAAPDRIDDLRKSFLDDPSPELRRGSVGLLIEKGQKELSAGETDEAATTLRAALDAARDVEQIRTIAKLLREKVSQPVDLPRHFGFLMYWHVIGPFDNEGREGFSRIYPPEESIDLTATYRGKTEDVSWQPYATTDEYGMVNFNDPYSPLKQVVGYAYTEFVAENDRTAELRLGCKNAWKIWFNGEFLFGRDEYHRGMRIDQYVLPINLKKGKNTILVKACQNEEDQNWTREWQFQLRVCDSSGTAILSTDRKPTPQKEKETP